MTNTGTNPPDSPLTTDLPCAKCHYNLRTKKPSELCPECAHPVADSITFHKNAAPRNPRRAMLGAFLLSAGFAYLPALLLFWRILDTFALTLSPLVGPILTESLGIVVASVTCVGILLFRNGALPATFASSAKSRLFLALVLLVTVAPLAQIVLAHLDSWTFIIPNSIFYSWSDLIYAAELSLQLILVTIGGWFMCRLGRRIHSRLLLLSTWVLFPAYAIQVVFQLAIFVPMLRSGFTHWSTYIFGFFWYFGLYFEIAFGVAFTLYWLHVALLFHRIAARTPAPTLQSPS